MILIIISIGLIFFTITTFLVYRLNIYIINLEKKIEEQVTLTENLKQSLKEVIADDYLQNDGRLKKFRIQKERNFIYNGRKLDEQDYEL